MIAPVATMAFILPMELAYKLALQGSSLRIPPVVAGPALQVAYSAFPLPIALPAKPTTP